MPTVNRPGIRTKPKMKKAKAKKAVPLTAAEIFKPIQSPPRKFPHWLERVREWIGYRLIDAGAKLLGL